MREPIRLSMQDLVVRDWSSFDDLLDTRSPSEFHLDHLPGALSAPVLDDAQRIEIGTLHKQVGPFEANRLGAAYVARNIARHLEERFIDRGRDWSALVYCWRGGQRSNAMATILARVGWRIYVLDGGYRAYRSEVVKALETLPNPLRWVVLAGRTGCGKSKLLQALARNGAQILDLESLAEHRGSVLGGLPGIAQPSQKWFESQLWHALRSLDPKRPVYVESESRKLGRIHVPDSLMMAMRRADCITVDAPVAVRAEFLVANYPYWVESPEQLIEQLGFIAPFHSKERIAAWTRLIEDAAWEEFVQAVLSEHYDPAYDRAMQRNFVALADALTLRTASLNEASINALAQSILERSES